MNINYIKNNKNSGIGDWGLGIGPNPQSPIPNPHITNNKTKTNKIINIIKIYNNK